MKIVRGSRKMAVVRKKPLLTTKITSFLHGGGCYHLDNRQQNKRRRTGNIATDSLSVRLCASLNSARSPVLLCYMVRCCWIHIHARVIDSTQGRLETLNWREKRIGPAVRARVTQNAATIQLLNPLSLLVFICEFILQISNYDLCKNYILIIPISNLLKTLLIVANLSILYTLSIYFFFRTLRFIFIFLIQMERPHTWL